MQASINGTRIVFDDRGRGPAVILLHGLPHNRTIWKPQITRLAEQGFRVIAPDLRGFGASEPGSTPFSIRIFAEDIARLMKHLGIGRAVLVGRSLGTEVVMEMLKRYPRKIVAAGLVAPLLPPVDAADRNRLWNLAELVREGHQETAVEGLCHWFFSAPDAQADAGQKTAFRQMAAANDPHTLAQGLAFWESYQGRSGRRERHAHPILLLTAKSDPVAPPERVAELLSLFSRGRHQLLPETAGLATNQAQESFSQALLDFLDEVSHCKPGRLRLAAARVQAGLGFNAVQVDDGDPEVIQEGIAPA